ncbi:MAG: ATP-binding cassette subfamily B protein [Planctomycetota bacterium]|jgi:ATP-binding cassette subfamily B protein
MSSRKRKQSQSLQVVRRFLPLLAEHRWRLLLAGMLSLGAATLTILSPWPIKWIFDGALVPLADVTHERSYYVWTGAAAALVLAISKALLDYFGTLKTTEVGHAFTRALRLRIFDHLTELSPLYHTRKKAGDLLLRLMGDVPMVRTMLVDSGVLLVTRMALVVGTVTVMFLVDPLLAGVLLALMPVLLLVIRLMAGRVKRAVRKQRRKEGAMADFLHEAISASTVIQALGRSRHTVRRFARSNRRTARAGMKVAKAAAAMSATVELLLGVSLVVAMALGSQRVLSGALTTGEFLVFLSYVRSLAKPIRSTAKHAAKVAKGAACGERILEVLDEEKEVRSSAGDRTAPTHPTRLSFEDVSFRYGDQQRALKAIDATLKSGQLSVLFGPSGAGKSTLTALALRLFDPAHGSVQLDGISLREYDLDSLRSCFGVSLQRTFLFGESIRENLFLGDPDADEEAMWEALRLVGAEELVRGLPDALDEVLGSSGSSLSGGQQRRLCLARAFLRRTPILIVDEPFAGLDQECAQRVAQALREYAREHLVLLITHDVSRLEEADQVLFLEAGRLRGSGTHAQLMESLPRYQELCRSGVERNA